MKKLLLGLGTIATIATPIIAVVSCGDDKAQPPKKSGDIVPPANAALPKTGANTGNHGAVSAKEHVDTTGHGTNPEQHVTNPEQHQANPEQSVPAKVTIDNSVDRTKTGRSSLTLEAFKLGWAGGSHNFVSLGLPSSSGSHMAGTELTISGISYKGDNAIITYTLEPSNPRINIVKYKMGTLTVTGFAKPKAKIITEIDNSQDGAQERTSDLGFEELKGNLQFPGVTIGMLRLKAPLAIHANVKVEYGEFTWETDHVEVTLKFTPEMTGYNTLKITSGILKIFPSTD